MDQVYSASSPLKSNHAVVCYEQSWKNVTQKVTVGQLHNPRTSKPMERPSWKYVSTIFKALLRKNHISYAKSKVTIFISKIKNFSEKNFDPPMWCHRRATMKTQNTNFTKEGHTVPQNDRWNLRNKKVNYNFFLRGHLYGVIGQNVRKSHKIIKFEPRRGSGDVILSSTSKRPKVKPICS